MDITAIHQIFLTCTSVTTDSRNCPQGSLFIALKGESFNGNAFAARALESGSAYAIVDEEAYAPEGDTRYIVVENSLKTLQQLANYHRRQMRTPIIGITGTNGKTTTKELMSTVLSQTHNVLYTLGNLNNHIGVPLTLLRLRPEHDLAVVEMGASHPGDIKELVEIAEPDYGIITNVGKAHLEGFGSFEGIIKTKGEMYDYLRTRKEATIFIHNDNPYLKKIAYGLHQIAYGSEDGLYINGHVTGNSPYLTFEWKTDNESKYHEVQTRLIGEYNFPNALAAVTIGHFFWCGTGENRQGTGRIYPAKQPFTTEKNSGQHSDYRCLQRQSHKHAGSHRKFPQHASREKNADIGRYARTGKRQCRRAPEDCRLSGRMRIQGCSSCRGIVCRHTPLLSELSRCNRTHRRAAKRETLRENNSDKRVERHQAKFRS